MRYTQELKTGFVYWVKDFTAPKLFNGLYFECLLTDQKIPAHCIAECTDVHILDWPHEIYKPERWNLKEHKAMHNAIKGTETYNIPR